MKTVENKASPSPSSPAPAPARGSRKMARRVSSHPPRTGGKGGVRGHSLPLWQLEGRGEQEVGSRGKEGNGVG